MSPGSIQHNNQDTTRPHRHSDFGGASSCRRNNLPASGKSWRLEVIIRGAEISEKISGQGGRCRLKNNAEIP
jgi:hypothetical protein